MSEEPTASKPSAARVPSLDLVRGVCVLLMLPATIPWFCRPFQLWDAHPQPAWQPDRIVIAVTLFFVDHKILTLFSLLFGMGLALRMRQPDGESKQFLRYYLWRMVLLFILGVAHTLLFWWGDLLSTYAIVGVHVLVIVALGGSMERLSLAVCFGWFYLLVCVVGLLSIVPLEAVGGPDLSIPPMVVARAGPPQSLLRGDEPIAEAFLNYMHPNNQERIYRNGSVVDQLEHRFILRCKEELSTIIFYFWYMLGCALFGGRFVRWGLVDDDGSRRRLSRLFVLVGLLVGVPLTLVAAVVYYFDERGSLAWSLSQLGALPMALLYLAILLAAANTGWLRGLQHCLQSIGRLALTNYLMQSLLCALLFHAYGFRLYGLPLTAALLIAVGIGVFQLFASFLWLHRFQQGPVEWLWRCLAAGRF